MLTLASQLVHHLINTKLFTIARYFLPGLLMYFALALPSTLSYAAAPDAGAVVTTPSNPSTTTTSTTVATTTTVGSPMLSDYTILVGGGLVVVAFFVRRLTIGWLHTPNGGLVILLISTVATSCAEAIQRKGMSKSVLIVAAGQAMLTFVAMSDAKPKTTDDQKDKS